MHYIVGFISPPKFIIKSGILLNYFDESGCKPGKVKVNWLGFYNKTSFSSFLTLSFEDYSKYLSYSYSNNS